MKNLIVNIYKTLFFFDFAVIVAFILPNIKSKKAVMLSLGEEGGFLAVMIVFTFVFWLAVERKRLKILNFKNFFANYSVGLIAAVVSLGLTVGVMWIFKLIAFKGFNKLENIILWLLAVLFNTLATELLLRGYLFKLYRKYYNIAAVTVVIVLLYISLNITVLKSGYINFANAMIFNVILCLLAEYTHSVIAPVTAHFIYNIVNGMLLGGARIAEECPVLLKTAITNKKYFMNSDNILNGSVITLICSLPVLAFLIFKFKVKKNK